MKKTYLFFALLIISSSCKKVENEENTKSLKENLFNYTITQDDKEGGFTIVNNSILMGENKFGIINNGTDIIDPKGKIISSYDGKFIILKDQKVEMSKDGKFEVNNKKFSWDEKGNLLINDSISEMKITPPNSEYYISASSIIYLYFNFSNTNR